MPGPPAAVLCIRARAGGPPIDSALGILAVVALVAANGFFVAAEFALVAADRPRIEHQAESGDRRAMATFALLRGLSFNLSAAQLGITITSLLLGFVAEPTVSRILFGEESGGGWNVVLAIVIATVFQMVFGEQVPKYLAIASPDGISRRVTPWMRAYGLLVRPFVLLLNGVANRMVRWFGIEPKEEIESSRTREEIEAVIRVSGAEGTLDPDEVDLLTRSIRFGEKTAADALTPRLEVHALPGNAAATELIELSVRTGKSRFPVFASDLDDVVGVAHVKSVYRLPFEDRATTSVGQLMRPALAVPETRDLDSLLDDMRASRDHLAIVVDEHGGTAGIITLEDLIEEIVGEIDDEYDSFTRLTRVEEQGSFVVSGRLHPDEVREATGFDLPDGPYETLAGFLLFRLGHLPVPSETVTEDGWRLEVVAMDARRIATVRVAQPSLPPVVP